MTKTEHYNLNQWDPEDKVLRTDFNEDNAKLDVALAALEQANPYVQLLSLTTTEAKTQINLDVSKFDLTRFQRLELYVAGTASGYCPIYVRLNGRTDKIYSMHGASSSSAERSELASFLLSQYPGGTRITLYFFAGQILVEATSVAVAASTSTMPNVGGYGYGSVKAADLSAKDIRTINLVAYPDQTISPGTEIRLTGVRI